MTPDRVRRFWGKVTQGGRNACWLWQGCRQPSRNKKLYYGRFTTDGGPIYAHRISYELACGPIPPGMKVLHTCDNGLCVNPRHLWLGTQQQNMDDMRAKGRARFLRGGEHPSSTLTEWQVAQIKWLLQQPIKRRAIADKFGVSRDVVGFIAREQTWREVQAVPVQFKDANRAILSEARGK